MTVDNVQKYKAQLIYINNFINSLPKSHFRKELIDNRSNIYM